jgi:hypothetical protein
MQSPPIQYQTQGGGSMIQQQNTAQVSQPYQSFNAGLNNMATMTSTTTTTTESIVTGMQGMSLGTPNQYQVQSPAPQHQYALQQGQPQIQSPPAQHQYAQQSFQPQPQMQNPQSQLQHAPPNVQSPVQNIQQQPQSSHPGFGGQQPQQVANFNQQQPVQNQGNQPQTPQSAGVFFQQIQSPYPVPSASIQQAPQ